MAHLCCLCSFEDALNLPLALRFVVVFAVTVGVIIAGRGDERVIASEHLCAVAGGSTG